MTFPTAPTNGTRYDAPGGQSWVFNADGAWQRASDGATVPTATAGLNVKPGGLVLSSDGTMMYNNTAATITVTTLTRAGLTTDGLVPFYTTLNLPSALGGTISTTPALAFHSGVAGSTTFSSSNGTAPMTWSVLTGTLPAGVTLNPATGVLSGTPTGTPGTLYNFTIRGSDVNGNYNDQSYNGTILGNLLTGGLTPTTVTVQNASPIAVTLTPGAGVAPYTYSISAGALPAGVVLGTSTGALTGTPTGAVGTAYNFTVRATDSAGNYVEQTYTGTVAVAPPPTTYPNKQVFSYTGGDQTFTVPATATWIRIKAWGAAGGGSNFGPVGGPGGFAQGEFSGLGGSTLTVVVGMGGTRLDPTTPVYGGGGLVTATSPARGAIGNAGGGLSGVFNGTFTAANALLVAGAGGGAKNGGSGTAGGAGGGATGGSLGAAQDGGGGTQSSGGAGGTSASVLTAATAGAALQGGVGGSDTTTFTDNGGGGGSGWFGGGGAAGRGAGGGGSGYVAPTGVNPLNLKSTGNTAANGTDVDYNGTAGNGAGGAPGNPGLVVVEWN